MHAYPEFWRTFSELLYITYDLRDVEVSHSLLLLFFNELNRVYK